MNPIDPGALVIFELFVGPVQMVQQDECAQEAQQIKDDGRRRVTIEPHVQQQGGHKEHVEQIFLDRTHIYW